MKNPALLALLFTACACAGPAAVTPPQAEQVFGVFMQNMALPLSNEPNCQQTSAANPAQSLTLGQHFATNLSVSYASDNNVSVKSSCTASKFEQENGQLQPVWDCKIELQEQDAQGEFISSSMTAFYLTADSKTLLPGSLRCF